MMIENTFADLWVIVKFAQQIIDGHWKIAESPNC